MIPSLERGLLLGTPVERSRARRVSAAPPVSVWDDGDGHLITFAPTGAGKGVSCIIPALLSWDGPAIVIDPKGENYAVTAARRRAFGQRVHLLDPFAVTGGKTDRLNPLDLIDIASPSAPDDAAVIAKLITQGTQRHFDPFWDERGEALIIGLILHVLKDQPLPLHNLAEVRHLVEAGHETQLLATAMSRSTCQDVRVAANILSLDSRVRSSIVTTASSQISFLRSEPVQHATVASTVPLADVVAGSKLTIYLVLPPDKLISHGKLLRLWLGVLMTAMARRRRRPDRPTLLLIDEAAQLGSLDQLRTAVTLMRGYGVTCWSFWQDLSQLQRIYPADWKSLVNNCTVQQYFGLSSPQAAVELSAYLGGALPRPLSQIKADEALLIRRGQPPQVVVRPDYLRDPMFNGLFAANPFYAADVEPGDLEMVQQAVSNVVPFPHRGR